MNVPTPSDPPIEIDPMDDDAPTESLARKPLVIVSGESSDRWIVPNLTPYTQRTRRVAGAIHWRALLTVIASAGVATAGTVGSVWAVRSGRFNEPASDVTASVEANVAEPPTVRPVPAASVEIRPVLAKPPATENVGVPPVHRASPAPRQAARAVAPRATHARTEGAAPLSCTQQCDGNVECILHCPYQGVESQHGLVNATPSHEQVTLAMQSVRGAVMMCGMGVPNAPRSVNVTVTFGSNGAPRDVALGRPFDGTGPGTCIARAIQQRARVPQFADASYRVTYPFAVQ